MRVGWSTDRKSAYLFDDDGNVVGRWFQGRPDISTFEPSAYAGGTTGATPVSGGTMYDVGQGGYYYGEETTDAYTELLRLGYEHADAQAALEENRRQFDQDLAYRQQGLAQEAEIARAQIASSEGMQRYEWEQRLRQLEAEIASNERIANADRASREKIADQQFAVRIREIEGQERITAAERWAKPIDYLAYNAWMAGRPAATTASGLPVGAPEFQTGLPAQGVGAGGVPTADVYGQRLAAGGRVSEFGAWGGPTAPVAGTPWVAPHQASYTQFARQPLQAQEMAYARWRQRGILPETAQQVMRAAAPLGTAAGAIRYG